MMYAIHAMGILRVSAKGEREGLDLHEHGTSAYPEFEVTPEGMPDAVAEQYSGAVAAYAER
jgi:Amt family ammonium transporter